MTSVVFFTVSIIILHRIGNRQGFIGGSGCVSLICCGAGVGFGRICSILSIRSSGDSNGMTE